MNEDTCCRNTRAGIYALGLLGALAIVGLLVTIMRHYTEAPPVFAVRSAERMEIMQQFKAANGPLETSYDWQDQTRGVVRVPLDAAKDLVLNEWRNPAAGRSNLVARAAKAFAPLPKAPEKKSEYE